jgi:hypothetical protein
MSQNGTRWRIYLFDQLLMIPSPIVAWRHWHAVVLQSQQAQTERVSALTHTMD